MTFERTTLRRTLLALLACCSALGLAGCGGQDRERRADRADRTCDGRAPENATVTVWFHNGQGAERDALEAQVAAFNAQNTGVRVKLVVLPETDYGALVQSAAKTGDLPDLLDFDGPNLYSYAWSGKLRPLDSCVPAALRDDLLPSIRDQGTYARRLWGLGTFDSGLGLYIRPSVLRKVGARIPAGADDAWTADEFTAILRRLQSAGYRHPLDLKIDQLAKRNEWPSYAFAPILWSAGGDLIDRQRNRAAGALNAPASVRALRTLQGWVDDGLVDPNTRNTAFTSGRAPISWVGHWEFRRYADAFPDDVSIAPLPAFGKRSRSGMGSWQWGLPVGAADGDAAWRFLQFLLSPAEILRMSRANGAVPARQSVLGRTAEFRVGGPERLYAEQLIDGTAMTRPATPAYPVITAVFADAVAAIVDGSDVRRTLDAAAARVDRDIDASHGYPAPN
jgi:multiple sugar transport system substrate-binding protein